MAGMEVPLEVLMYCFKVTRRNRVLRVFLIFTSMTGLCETALLSAWPTANRQQQPVAVKPTVVQSGTVQSTTNRSMMVPSAGLNPTRVVYSKPVVPAIRIKSSFLPSYRTMLFLGGAGIVVGWLGYKFCGWTYGLSSLMSMINGSSVSGSGSVEGSNVQPQQQSGLFFNSQPEGPNLQQPLVNNLPQQSVYNFIPQNQPVINQNQVDISGVKHKTDLSSSFFTKPKLNRKKLKTNLTQSVFGGAPTANINGIGTQNNVQVNNNMSQSMFNMIPTNTTTQEESFESTLSSSYNGEEVIETPEEQKKRFMPGTNISSKLKDKILHLSHVLVHDPKTKNKN